jgi:preprotein translocase subunit SecE
VSGVRVAPPVQKPENLMKIINYFKESYNELVHKVTWPSWDELQSSAIIVMISTLIIAIIIALMDLGFKTIMENIYVLFY